MIDLNQEPSSYPGCCLSLSTKLLNRVVSLICAPSATPTKLVRSIGCGTGLFESLLAQCLDTVSDQQTTVEVVEVLSTEVKHLSPDVVHRVRGTRDLSEAANGADFLIFVYPRDGALLEHGYFICKVAGYARYRAICKGFCGWLADRQLPPNPLQPTSIIESFVCELWRLGHVDKCLMLRFSLSAIQMRVDNVGFKGYQIMYWLHSA